MTSTEIANMALGHLNISSDIADLDTERSSEARSCRRFYAVARDVVLRDFDWYFARIRTELALVEEDPNDEWGFSYRYPSNCLMLRKIWSTQRNDSRQTQVSYEIVQDGTGSLIYTDQEDAVARYTSQVTNPNFFQPDFVLALSARLAAYIAPALTGGDPFKLGERAFQVYSLEIGRARVNAANEEQPEQEVESEFYRIRDGATGVPIDE